MARLIRHHFLLTFLLANVAISMIGCELARNTLAQDLAWEQWYQCNQFPEIELKEIRQDGQIWVWNRGGHLSEWRTCILKAREDQARRGLAAVPAASTEPVPAAAARGPVLAPVWRAGDEWAYRWEAPNGLGTFVWEVDGVEPIGGVPHYVIKTGTRRIYYRVNDLGFTREELDGKIVREITPSTWRFAAFPLTVGASWTMKYHEDRPVDRQSEEIERRCTVEAEEVLRVPAGTFSTFRISCRNLRNDTWLVTFWYSPQVKHLVREEAAVTGGKRIRELITLRLR